MWDVTNIDLHTHARRVERLFVLGAGFSNSVYPEFPLTCDLLERLFDEDVDLRQEWRSLASLFTPFLRVREVSGVPEISSVLTVIEAYRGIVRKTGNAEEQICKLRTRLLYAANGFLYRTSVDAATRPVLTDFVNLLDPERDAILTLNWDVALEKALDLAKVPFQFDVLPSVADGDHPEGLLILKPQGSVGWYRINPLPAASPDVRSEPVLIVRPAPPTEEWRLSRRTDPPLPFLSPCPLAADPAIIPPGFVGEDRARELDWSGYLLRIATNAAIHATRIVVVGYSLPPDDFHVQAALSFGIPQDSSGQDGVDIFVIDPSRQAFHQWRNAFGGFTTNTAKPVSVYHWAPTLAEALQRKGGPWASSVR